MKACPDRSFGYPRGVVVLSHKVLIDTCTSCNEMFLDARALDLVDQEARRSGILLEGEKGRYR